MWQKINTCICFGGKRGHVSAWQGIRESATACADKHAQMEVWKKENHMKWSGWIVFSFAAAFAVAMNAAEPRLAPPRLAKVSVNAARFAEEPNEAPPAAAPRQAPITPHAPVLYRQASWDIWSGTATGYVYAPGACDYTPPCVNHLWDGYVQRPHRCYPPHMHGCHGQRGCGSSGGCDTCGSASSCGCGGHCSLLKRAHGWHFGGKVWGGCSSCGDIAPSCAAPSCGCDGIGGKGTYDMAPAPADAPPAPPAPMPTADGDAPTVEAPAAPAPLPEKTTRGQRLRGFTWPESSLQR